MPANDLEKRLLAFEIALDGLLAEIGELRDRLEAHARTCTPPNEIHLT